MCRILAGRSADTYVFASGEKLGTVANFAVVDRTAIAGVISAPRALTPRRTRGIVLNRSVIIEGEFVGLFAAACPVPAREQKWIEESAAWLRATFGEPRPVVPPDAFALPLDVPGLVRRLCQYLDVDPDSLTIELYGDTAEDDLARATGLTLSSQGAAGHYRREGGRPIIAIDRILTPLRMIATVAHELCHVRLDERDVIEEREDHEPLTDLATVHFGLGIFTANAAFEFSQDNRWRSVRRLGYLTEPMFGYGLAYHAWLRGESRPEWARHLDTNPRAYLKRGLRYLAKRPRP